MAAQAPTSMALAISWTSNGIMWNCRQDRRAPGSRVQIYVDGVLETDVVDPSGGGLDLVASVG